MASGFQPNPSQAKVLDSTENLCVVAGAGSGKTGTLVALITKFLEDAYLAERKISITEIMALTFTEKAASEMRLRLYENFAAKAQTSQGVESDFWRRQSLALDRAEIGTIHSYALRLIKSRAYHFNLPPGLEIEDEAETAENDLHNILTDWLEEGETNLLKLLDSVSLGRLKKWLLMSQNRLNSWGLDSLSIDEKSVDGFLEIDLASLKVLLAEAKNCAASFDPQKNYRQVVLAALNKMEQCLLTTDDGKGPEINVWAGRLVEMSVHLTSSGDWYKKEGRQLKKELALCLEEIGQKIAIYLALPLKRAFLALANQVPLLAWRLKAQRGALSYDDILILARRLLCQNTSLRREEKERYKLIIIDEFQDTNRLQADLVAAILTDTDKELAEHDDHWRNLNWAEVPGCFKIFGDPKQSIYRFRGGEPWIMSFLQDAFQTGSGAVLPLAVNYRSQKPLVDFFNAFFQGYLPPHLFGELDRQEAQRPSLSAVKPVACISSEDKPKLIENQLRMQSQWLCAYLTEIFTGKRKVLVGSAEKARAPQTGDVAILLRRLKYAHIFEEALSGQGWPCQQVANQALLDYEEIKGALAALFWLWHEEREINLAGFLRSPLGPVSDAGLSLLAWSVKKGQTISAYFENTKLSWPQGLGHEDLNTLERLRHCLTSLQKMIGRRPLVEILEKLLEDNQVFSLARLSPDGLARVRALQEFLALARLVPIRREKSPQNPVRLLRNLLARSYGGNESESPALENQSIKIMSVHKAKGLEFPVVIVPEADFKMQNRSSGLIINQLGQMALSLKSAIGFPFEPLDYQELYAKEEIEEFADHQRLFYVAATRAKDHLALMGWPAKKGGNSWFEALAGRADLNEYVEQVAGEDLILTADSVENATEEAEFPVFNEELLSSVVPRILTLPVTSLSHLLADPKGYFREVRLGLTQDYSQDLPPLLSGEQTEISPSELGIIFHAVLEEEPEDLLSQLRDAAQKRQLILTKPWEDFLALRLNAFHQSPLGRLLAGARKDNLLVKHEMPLWFYYSLPSLKMDWSLSGVIDLFFIDQNGCGQLVDYKLARFKKNGTDLKRYEYQMAIYAQALRCAGFSGPLKASLFFAGEEVPVIYELPLNGQEPLAPLIAAAQQIPPDRFWA